MERYLPIAYKSKSEEPSNITKEEMVPNVAYPTEPTEIVYENPYKNFILYAEHR